MPAGAVGKVPLHCSAKRNQTGSVMMSSGSHRYMNGLFGRSSLRNCCTPDCKSTAGLQRQNSSQIHLNQLSKCPVYQCIRNAAGSWTHKCAAPSALFCGMQNTQTLSSNGRFSGIIPTGRWNAMKQWDIMLDGVWYRLYTQSNWG